MGQGHAYGEFDGEICNPFIEQEDDLLAYENFDEGLFGEERYVLSKRATCEGTLSLMEPQVLLK